MTSSRQHWLIWIGFIFFVVFCTWFGDHIKRNVTDSLSTMNWVLAGLASWTTFSSFVLPSKLLRAAAQAALKGDVRSATKKWSAAKVLSWACANAIVLWGLVASTTGSPEWFPFVFDLVGFALLLLHRPVKPSFLPADF